MFCFVETFIIGRYVFDVTTYKTLVAMESQVVGRHIVRVRWFIFWKTIIFQGSRGGPTFYRVGVGVQLFSRGGGGVQMLISVETYRNFDFPRTPYPLSVSAHVLPSLKLGPSNRSTFVGCVQAWAGRDKLFSYIYL